MCDNCTKHGEGRKWFLQAKNYSDDLLVDLGRAAYIRDFFAVQARQVGRKEPMEGLRLIPRPLRRMLRAAILQRLAIDHYGQIVTLEEVRKIMGLAAAVVRLPCVCRRITAQAEKRYCFGLSLRPDGLGVAGLVDASYWQGPDGQGLERLTPAQAVRLIEELDHLGLVHSVWTFKTPFIGGLCNCSARECRAMLASLAYDLPMLHRGEAVAFLQPALCLGCGACSGRCQFGALSFDGERRRPALDTEKCFGCGLCATACPVGAITLAEPSTSSFTSAAISQAARRPSSEA